MEEIEKKARSGKPGLRGLMEEDLASILDEIAIISSGTNESLGFKEPKEMDTEVIIGEGRDVRFPLLLRHPIFVDAGPMKNVNKSVRTALAYGASITKTPINIGEGMLPEEKKIEKKFKSDFILQWSPMRIGIDMSTMGKAKAVVINLNYTNSGVIYPQNEILNILQGKGGLVGAEILGPSRHLDILAAEDLKKHVELLREATEYKIPIMIKIPSQDVYEGTKTAIEANSDAVIIDTSTDAFSTLSSINGTFGATLMGSIPPAKKAFKGTKAKDKGIKLLVSGGFRNANDAVKVMAMGADAVGIAEGAVVALGCNLCGECHLGECERGIATKDLDLKSRFNWKSAGKALGNYLKATKKEMEVLLGVAGVSSIRDLESRHIMALTYDAAAITGIRLTGYDKELPMWFH